MSASIDFTSKDLTEVLEYSIKLSLEAGKLMREGSNAIQRSSTETLSPDTIEEKMNSVDLVTKYDKAVEDLVRGEIAKAYPSYLFMGEEETSILGKLPELTDAPTFCVDPIDGTTNFIHGLPFSCVSIGLIWKKRPVMGVIYNPFLDWLYYGAEGQGSYVIRSGGEPQKLPLSPARPLPSLSQAVIDVEWGSDRSFAAMKARADSFVRLAGDGKENERGKMVHALRSIGCASMIYASVASGQLDIYWEIGCWPWDICAGAVIVQEAGGMASTSDLSIHGGEVTGDISDKVLYGRKYICIRAIADTSNESGREIQKRLIKEFCETVDDYTPP